MQSNKQHLFHVTQTPVKLWHGQQALNQTDKAIDLILNCDAIQILTSFQSVVIKICYTLKEANSNGVITIWQKSTNKIAISLERNGHRMVRKTTAKLKAKLLELDICL